MSGIDQCRVCPGAGCQVPDSVIIVTSIPALPVLTSSLAVDAVRLDPEAGPVSLAVARVTRVKLPGRRNGLREEDGGAHTGELGPQGGGGRGGPGQALEVVEGGEERDLVPGAGEGSRVLNHHVLVGVTLPVRVRLQLSLGQVQLPL